MTLPWLKRRAYQVTPELLILGLTLHLAAVSTCAAEPRGSPMAITVIGGPSVPEDKPQRHTPMPDGDQHTALIKLERFGCYGDCAVYSVEARGDGAVAYNGQCHVVVDGAHGVKIEPKAVEALLDEAREADFWSLKTSYAARAYDAPRYRLSITVGGKTKVIDDYLGTQAGMPEAIAKLQDSVDRATGVDRWIVGDESTIPSLKAEGWDFRSLHTAIILARAAGKSPESLALQLLELGASPVAKADKSDCYPPDLWSTAAEAAAANGRLKLLKRLIATGALSADGRATATLFAAVYSGNPAVVAEVLRYHPNVNAHAANGGTPLGSVEDNSSDDDAPKADLPGVARLLLAAGANPALADSQGDTPLHNVSDVDVAKLLIRAGAPLEARNNAGETPLLATLDEDVALALIDAGANIHARARDGATLRQVAKQQRWDRVLKRLNSARTNQRGASGHESDSEAVSRVL